jgi:hypothetical protein
VVFRRLNKMVRFPPEVCLEIIKFLLPKDIGNLGNCPFVSPILELDKYTKTWVEYYTKIYKQNVKSQLLWANERGYIDVIQMIFKEFTIDERVYEYARIAVIHGHLEVVKWYFNGFSLDIIDRLTLVRWATIYTSNVNCGQLKVLQWLHKFGLTLCEQDTIFANAVEYGKLEALKWLHNTGYQPERHIILFHFKYAAASGHFEVLMWLKNTFNLTVEELNSIYGFATFFGDRKTKNWLDKNIFMRE